MVAAERKGKLRLREREPLPKVTQQGEVGARAVQAYSSDSGPSAARDRGTHLAGVRGPQRHSSRRRPPPVWSSRILKDPSPHSLTGDQPAATVRPGRPGSQPEPLSEAESFNKPGDAGLETSPCFSWAGRLLFIAAWGWRRVPQTPPVTGVFGGDEPAPENPRRGTAGLQGAGRRLPRLSGLSSPARRSPARPALSPGAARP